MHHLIDPTAFFLMSILTAQKESDISVAKVCDEFFAECVKAIYCRANAIFLYYFDTM